MTKEEAMQIYTADDWGVYKYHLREKRLIEALIQFSDRHPDNVCLDFYADKEQFERVGELFDLDNLRIYLYYYERDVELEDDIDEIEVLRNTWFDSDCYTLQPHVVEELKASTPKTKQLLRNILALSKQYEQLTYNKDK